MLFTLMSTAQFLQDGNNWQRKIINMLSLFLRVLQVYMSRLGWILMNTDIVRESNSSTRKRELVTKLGSYLDQISNILANMRLLQRTKSINLQREWRA
jgi:hypothetical protein